MFTTNELSAIDPSYFRILQAGAYCVTLQSKNTRHYWHLIAEDGQHYSSCQISHKHHYEDPYHRHRNRPDLKSALHEICSHDTFHIKRQKKKHS